MLLIDAIAHVESADRNVPGDHGAALSPFQIHRGAWEDVKRLFGKPGGDIYLNIGERFEDISNCDPRSPNYDCRMFARNCATGYWFILQQRLSRAGVSPSPENIYACWNLGFHKFKRRGFDLSRCPASTIANARRVAELVIAREPPSIHNGHD